VTDRTRDDYFTFFSDVEYLRNTKTPNANKYFTQLQPNKKEREYLRKCLGYMLSGDTSAQVFFIMYGGGENGKSLLCKLMGSILKQYYCQLSKSIIMKCNKNETGPSPEK